MTHLLSARRATTAALLALLTGATTFLAAPPSANAAKVYDGPDVASYQHPGTTGSSCGKAINWKKVRNAGKEFAIVKATEGSGYTNPCFAQDYAGSQSAGLVRGSYHFARPALPIVSTAVQQAKHYAAVIGDVTTSHTLPPVLDFEVTGGLSQPQLITWAQVFLLEMRSITGRTPMLYTYPSFWSSTIGDPAAFSRFPLWMASYGVSQAPTADLWQYTSGAHVAGISGAVDMSKFVGALGRAWSTLSDGSTPTPWATRAPGQPVNVHAALSGTSVRVSWLPGDAGSSRIRQYRVTTSPGGASTVVSGTTTAATIDGLASGQSYSFSVTALNSAGAGTRSAASNVVVPSIPTSLTTHVGATSVPYGSSVSVKATLRRSDTKAAMSGSKVLVFRRAHPGGSWVRARRLVADANGRVSTTLRPKRSDDFEVVYPGRSGFARSQDYATVKVRPVVTAALSQTQVSKGSYVKLTGTVTPAVAGQKVIREGYYSGAWHVWDTKRVSESGTYSFRIHATVRTTNIYRVVAAATNGRGSGHSGRLRLEVT